MYTLCDKASKKGPNCTEYTISPNGKYLEFCVQYLLSVNCIFTDGKRFTATASVNH